MLEFRINSNLIDKDKRELKLISDSDITSITETPITSLNDKLLMTCDCEDVCDIVKGSIINCVTTFECSYEGSEFEDYNKTLTFNDTYVVAGVDRNNSIITFHVNKFINFPVEAIYTQADSSDYVFDEESGEYRPRNIVQWVYIRTSSYTYYDNNDFEYYAAKYNTDKDERWIGGLFMRYTDTNGVTTTVDLDELFTFGDKQHPYAQFVTPWTIKIASNTEDGRWFGPQDNKKDSEMNKLFRSLFGENSFDDGYNANLWIVNVMRNSLNFSNRVNYHLYYNHASTKINIPLKQEFELNTNQSDNLTERFVDIETRKAINDIIDMEKDVYQPVFYKSESNYIPIKEIRFNLHFLQHVGDKWSVDRQTMWNGVKSVKTNGNYTHSLMSDMDGGANIGSYFTYSQKEHQSDLLSYLGFTNSDIRYQKNRLKKSFLRLLYYDNTDSMKQQLLGYATIFLNTDELFGKYCRYYDDTVKQVLRDEDSNNKLRYLYKYEMTNNEPSDGTTEGTEDNNATTSNDTVTKVEYQNGIRIDRESFFGSVVNDSSSASNCNVDTYRLSSQFKVRNRNDATSSSEGFYFYMYKDELNDEQGKDVYLKIEFNHAGFGRTIPFIMPYNDKGIETFEQIVGDWSNYDSEKYTSDIKGYTIRQFEKFSYIKLKCKKIDGKYIYYLDNELYKGVNRIEEDTNYTWFDENDGVLNIDLYEGKIK